ncbi:MAG: extracellular solute-binding protein [Planctomycetes bacterium]|nr:extracellular solute-binding protein [Planctomycetota bacterium]
MRRPHFVVALLFVLAATAAWMDRRPSVAESVASAFTFTAAGEQPKPLAQETVHIVYWEKWNGFEGDAMQNCVDAFNDESQKAFDSKDLDARKRFLTPDGKPIFVHMLSTTHVNRKALLAVSGGVPPDLAGLWSRDVPDFAFYEAALPLDEWLARDGPPPEAYHPCYWSMCVYRGHVWALPTTPSTIALHWNKNLFKEAGLDPDRPPRTLAELDAYNRKLTKRDENGRLVQMGFLPTEPGWWNYGWGNWFGGKFVSEDGRTLLCDTQPWIDAYAWLDKMAAEFGREGVSSFRGGIGNFDSPHNAFIAGKVAMVLQGVWMANFIRRYKPAMRWGVAPFPGPGGSDAEPVSIAQADVLVIPRGCPNPEAAWRFARYVSSTGPDDPSAPLEGMEILCDGQGKHTPFRHATPRFLAEHRHEQLKVFIDLGASPNAVIEPLMPIWKEYRLGLQAAFEKLWLKGDQPGVTPESVLKELKDRLQPKLDNAWKKIEALDAERAKAKPRK